MQDEYGDAPPPKRVKLSSTDVAEFFHLQEIFNDILLGIFYFNK